MGEFLEAFSLIKHFCFSYIIILLPKSYFYLDSIRQCTIEYECSFHFINNYNLIDGNELIPMFHIINSLSFFVDFSFNAIFLQIHCRFAYMCFWFCYFLPSSNEVLAGNVISIFFRKNHQWSNRVFSHIRIITAIRKKCIGTVVEKKWLRCSLK